MITQPISAPKEDLVEFACPHPDCATPTEVEWTMLTRIWENNPRGEWVCPKCNKAYTLPALGTAPPPIPPSPGMAHPSWPSKEESKNLGMWRKPRELYKGAPNNRVTIRELLTGLVLLALWFMLIHPLVDSITDSFPLTFIIGIPFMVFMIVKGFVDIIRNYLSNKKGKNQSNMLKQERSYV